MVKQQVRMWSSVHRSQFTYAYYREKTHEGIKEVVKPFDWSYTTDYKGTITSGKDFELQTEKAEPIPIELLKRPDPILFFEEVVLYESELDDNGISVLSCKVRVMPDRMLLLTRLFMRLDDVLVRVRDTRVYVDFNTRKVIRDYTEKEEDFEKVTKVCFHVISRPLTFVSSLHLFSMIWGLHGYLNSFYCHGTLHILHQSVGFCQDRLTL